ncbi:hypothetical protein N7451_012670 [Penicillium sp. IBT 35674x]|nr:hypothetical protein N7451_012670 [Penicillium sp. IBT 35674x]
MEQRHGHKHQVDHFGFDPVSLTTHTEDQKEYQNSTCDNCTCETRIPNCKVARKLCLDEAQSYDVPKAHNFGDQFLDSSFGCSDEYNACTGVSFWGFDPPAANTDQRLSSRDKSKHDVVMEKRDVSKKTQSH